MEIKDLVKYQSLRLTLLLVIIFSVTNAIAEETDSLFYTFPHSEINFEALCSNPSNGCVCVEDFNEDGYPDLIVSGPRYEDFNWACMNLLLNDGGKGFIKYELGLQPVSNGSISAHRINKGIYLLAVQGGTGVTATAENSVAYVARLVIRGNNVGVTKLQNLTNGISGGSILFADLNDDGKKDIIQFGNGSKVYAYLESGSDRFVKDEKETELLGAKVGQQIAADMDNDGREDIITIDDENGLLVYFNQGNGTFSQEKANKTLLFKSVPRMGLGDFNEDGKMDIVAFDYVSETDKYSVAFYYQNEDHTFTEVVSNHFMGVAAASVGVADFNGDGHTDVLYSGTNNRVWQESETSTICAKAYFLLGDGKGGFEGQVKWNKARNSPDIFCLAPVTEGTYSIADFDGDEKPDIFALGKLGVPMSGKTLRTADMFLSSKTYGWGEPVAAPAVHTKWQGFDYDDVRLSKGSRLKTAADKEIAYLKRLDINKLFASMQEYNLGISGYQPYGGWEADGYGCTFAHYTSALAIAYASTGDDKLLTKINKCVEIMLNSQARNGDGFFAFKAGTTRAFDKMAKEKTIVPYGWDENGHPWGNNGIGFPFYAHHKVFASLRDVYLYAHNEEARIGFLKLCDWLFMWLQNFDETNLQKMLESEHGGMVEVLADAYALSGKSKYLDAAQRMTRNNFATTMSNNIDDLAGRHANMHVPMAVGAAEYYLYGGDVQHRKIAHNFFDMVANHHSLANGGNCNYERFSTPDLITYSMGPRSSETCTNYNMLKLAKQLFCLEGDPSYMDYYENVMLNHILGTLSTNQQEGVCYYTSLKPGTFKCYDNLFSNFWCCVGTGMESHVKYADAIFFKGEDGLLVNLLTPASLDWKEKGLQLNIETTFPAKELTTIRIQKNESFQDAIHLRFPSWAEEGSMQVSLNGAEVPVKAKPGELFAIENEWQAGDIIEIRLTPHFRLVDLPDDINVSAIFYGPVMLGATLGAVGQNFVGTEVPGEIIEGPAPDFYFPEIKHSRKDLASLFEVVDADKLMFKTIGLSKNYNFRPFYDIHRVRYNVYWKIGDDEDVALEKQLIADHVIPGLTSNEKAHNIQSEKSTVGNGTFNNWGPSYFYYRDAKADGYIQYDLNLLNRQLADDEFYYLQVTYFGSEPAGSGNFNIYIDDSLLKRVGDISNLAPLDFVQQYYKIPRKLTDGKNKITVRFSEGNVSVYGLRLLTENHIPPIVTAIAAPKEDDVFITYGQGSLCISSANRKLLNSDVAVYNINGQQIFHTRLNRSQANLPLSLARGVYIVSINNDSYSETRKIGVY